MKIKSLTAIVILFFISPTLSLLQAQTSEQSAVSSVLQCDSLFWAAYNNCDIENMMKYVSDDVEIYHDKSGILNGIKEFRNAFEKNLCGKKDYHLRREAIEGSVNVYPMQNGDTIYGAIISGEQLFQILDKGKDETLDGYGKFMNFWLLNKDSSWKMSRILSYNHGPAPYGNAKREITLSPDVLKQYEGNYDSNDNGIVTIKSEGASLILLVSDMKLVLHPEAENIFFTKERDLAFEFVKNNKNEIIKMIVSEDGNVVEEDEYIK